MTVDELRADAEAAKAEGRTGMVLVLYRATEPRGGTVRLLGRSGPKGRFVGAEQVGPRQVKVIADFTVADLLEWAGPAPAQKEEASGG